MFMVGVTGIEPVTICV